MRGLVMLCLIGATRAWWRDIPLRERTKDKAPPYPYPEDRK
jgi:hypothetical protein